MQSVIYGKQALYTIHFQDLITIYQKRPTQKTKRRRHRPEKFDY